MSAYESQKLPSDYFNTEWLDVRDRWSIWREIASVIFETAPPPSDSPPLTASIRGFYPGSVAFTETYITPQRYERSRQKIARDGTDHYMVTLYLDGGAQGAAGGKDIKMRRGDLCILDLGQPVSTHQAAWRTLSLFIPRAALDSVLPASHGLHGSVLGGDTGLGMILSDQLVALRGRLPDLPRADGPLVAGALVDLVAACFRPTAESLNRARAQVATATLDLVKRHIEERLTSPALSPDSIAADFRMSRSSLYRLFEPLGGVSAYIQERRLARAYATLLHPANRHRPIYDIAFDCGFANESHFSRAFRFAFGLPPSELRALGETGNNLPRGGEHMLKAGYPGRLGRYAWWTWRG
jgi:AraC-like DNA-binding protein